MVKLPRGCARARPGVATSTSSVTAAVRPSRPTRRRVKAIITFPDDGIRVRPSCAGRNVRQAYAPAREADESVSTAPTLAAVTGSTPSRGTFITIEGPDGGGKSSVAARLREVLATDGFTVTLVREPGGTPSGERIRAMLLDADSSAPLDPRVEALLFNAARAQLVAQLVRPRLEAGAVVVCDRFADSTLAYQGAGSGVPVADLRALEAVATAGLRPDLTVLLDVPAEMGLARKAGSETRFERDFDLDYHRRVRQGFLALAAAEPDRFVVVDATRAADAVLGEVVAAVHRVVRPLPDPGLAAVNRNTRAGA